MISGLIALVSTLPTFSPENIFLKTNSFPGTRGQVLLNRVRESGVPTTTQEQLCQLFEEIGKPAVRIYAHYGPDVLLNNPLSRSDELDADRWFLLYAVPSILKPHLMHLLALGIATSGFLSGKEGSRWRTIAILAGLAVVGLEVYLIETFDLAASMRGHHAKDVPYIHWQVRIWRGVAIAVVDGVLGWMIWLQATGRAFVTPDSPIEKVADQVKHLEALLQKVGVLGVAWNGSMRDTELRGKVNDYWVKEQEAMTDILQQPEVVQAQRQVVASRNMGDVSKGAGQFVDEMVMTMAKASAPSPQ